MKYAIISDVHGNWHALTAALKDAGNEGADAFLFVGDYCMCSAYVNEIVESIKALPNAYVIAGNGEGYLRNLHSRDQAAWTDGQYGGLYWCYKAITKENHAYLAFYAGASVSPADLEAMMWIDHVLDDTKPLLVKPEQALVVTQILDAIYESAKTGKPVYFD